MDAIAGDKKGRLSGLCLLFILYLANVSLASNVEPTKPLTLLCDGVVRGLPSKVEPNKVTNKSDNSCKPEIHKYLHLLNVSTCCIHSKT